MNEKIKQTAISNYKKLLKNLEEEQQARQSRKFFLFKINKIINRREILSLEIQIEAQKSVLAKLEMRSI